MLLKDIIKEIEKIAPPELQASWDKSGMQVATEEDDIGSMAVFLDPVPASVETALTKGADFMLAHHPLSLKPELPAKLNDYHKVLQLLLSANVGLYSAHTSLDVNISGPAGWFGEALGLKQIEVLEPLASSPNYGYGGIGILPKPVPLMDFINKILVLTKLKSGIYKGQEKNVMIEKVAWCGGSGSSMIEQAQKANADIFISGDLKYHAALEAAIPLLDVGHHSLEEEMMARMAVLLQEKLPEMQIVFIPSKSPFKIIERKAGSVDNE